MLRNASLCPHRQALRWSAPPPISFPKFLVPSESRTRLVSALSWPRPYKNQIEERPRPNLPSRAPDGVDVRVKLLHSRSQELEEPLGEEVAACGPRHGGSCPGHSGGTSSRHHELPLQPEPAARAAGNWNPAEVRRQGAPGECQLWPRPGISGKRSLWRQQGGAKGRALELPGVVVLCRPWSGGFWKSPDFKS